MTIYRVFLLIVIYLLLAGCAMNLITMDQIQNVTRDMTGEEVRLMLEKPPQYDYLVNGNDQVYYAEVYQMQTGTKTCYSPPTQTNPVGGTYTVPITDDYLFLYKDNKLYFWGFFNELSKSEDEEIQGISQDIIDGFSLAKKAKNNYNN
ncbi:MAG: hypothetical protein K9N06_13295 [Candidatus Cloacimonetes bacterium]|nr:hypothetical protein [Candidatus Cloacimonadota bacterium]